MTSDQDAFNFVKSENYELAKRIAELEAFVREIEIIETSWVTGVVDAQSSMVQVSEAWAKVRK